MKRCRFAAPKLGSSYSPGDQLSFELVCGKDVTDFLSSNPSISLRVDGTEVWSYTSTISRQTFNKDIMVWDNIDASRQHGGLYQFRFTYESTTFDSDTFSIPLFTISEPGFGTRYTPGSNIVVKYNAKDTIGLVTWSLKRVEIISFDTELLSGSANIASSGNGELSITIPSSVASSGYTSYYVEFTWNCVTSYFLYETCKSQSSYSFSIMDSTANKFSLTTKHMEIPKFEFSCSSCPYGSSSMDLICNAACFDGLSLDASVDPKLDITASLQVDLLDINVDLLAGTRVGFLGNAKVDGKLSLEASLGVEFHHEYEKSLRYPLVGIPSLSIPGTKVSTGIGLFLDLSPFVTVTINAQGYLKYVRHFGVSYSLKYSNVLAGENLQISQGGESVPAQAASLEVEAEGLLDLDVGARPTVEFNLLNIVEIKAR